jgi:hypothetical protein
MEQRYRRALGLVGGCAALVAMAYLLHPPGRWVSSAVTATTTPGPEAPVLAAVCRVPSGGATTGPQDDWRPVRVPSVGLTLSLPPGWSDLPLSSDGDAASSDPGGGESIEDVRVRIGHDGVAPILLEMAPLGDDGYMGVSLMESLGLDRDGARAATESTGDIVGSIATTDTVISGLPAFHAVYGAEPPAGSEGRHCFHHYTAVGHAFLWVVSFVDSRPRPDLYDRIVATVSIDPRLA